MRALTDGVENEEEAIPDESAGDYSEPEEGADEERDYSSAPHSLRRVAGAALSVIAISDQ